MMPPVGPTAILPGARLGVMGGGQLGAMFAMAARRMGYRVEALSDVADCPAARHSDTLHVVAYDDARRPVAGALNLVGSRALFGRHWGAARGVDMPGLLFELSYYQAIEHAIEHGLSRVEAGAQGEHKLARGYVPVKQTSFHSLVDPRLDAAVRDFLRRERAQMAGVLEVLGEEASPYKKV